MYRLISLLAVLFLLFSCSSAESNKIAKDKCDCPEFKYREVIPNYPGSGFYAITASKYLNSDCTMSIFIYGQQGEPHATSGDCHVLNKYRNEEQ